MPEASVAAKALLFAALALLALLFLGVWWTTERHARTRLADAVPSLAAVAIGALTDFLDTLGIGSFAITTSLYKLGRVIPDEEIPGTMNVGHAVPTLAEAFIFIAVVEVDIKTLSFMVGAAATPAGSRARDWPWAWRATWCWARS